MAHGDLPRYTVTAIQEECPDLRIYDRLTKMEYRGCMWRHPDSPDEACIVYWRAHDKCVSFSMPWEEVAEVLNANEALINLGGDTTMAPREIDKARQAELNTLNAAYASALYVQPRNEADCLRLAQAISILHQIVLRDQEEPYGP